MYRWYGDTKACYARPHDVDSSSFLSMEVEWMAGVVLTWVDATGDDGTTEFPILQQGWAAHRRQDKNCMKIKVGY